METIVVVLLVLCLAGIVAGRAVPALRRVSLIMATVLVAFVAWISWSVLLMAGLVPLDPLLERLGIAGLEQQPWWPTALFLGPPIVVAVAFGALVWRLLRPGSRDGRRRDEGSP